MNKIAKKLGSECKLRAFNRSGMHNWCMILVVPVNAEREHIDQFTGTEMIPDGAMNKAISIASNLNLDDCIVVTTYIQRAGIRDKLKRALEESEK